MGRARLILVVQIVGAALVVEATLPRPREALGVDLLERVNPLGCLGVVVDPVGPT